MWSNKNKMADAINRDSEEMEVKVVIVGDTQCGKTALVQRFISDNFNEAYTPTGFEKYSTTYNVSDYKITFSAWDTSGTQAYDTVRPLAYQDAGVFLLCFTVSDPTSLQNAVTKWYKEIKTHCPGPPVILCACRIDLRNDPDIIGYLAKHHQIPVNSEQAIAVSRQLGATTYVETSAKTSSKGVKDAFEVAALAALGKLNKNHTVIQKQVGRSKSKRDLKAELKGRAKSCCVM
ncbi:ras-like GTP-binding protein Rho1 [Arctopsyche grandis]|uniref:ras-like GTP-binding protein Rho1 n=1 Tax=Arctopsyche grandis TaxID=121162 RepID=UPI00406D7F0F